MESVLEEAKSKGMVLVNHEDLSEIRSEFDSEIQKADKLCDAIDPEETPFKSKYEALNLLERLCSKMEATRTIASLEKNRSNIEELNWRIAKLRLKIGSIYWDCEDFPNAQNLLDLALEYYFPGLGEDINKMCGDESEKRDISKLEPPIFNIPVGRVVVDAMKCLNILGILWAGRGKTSTSFLYLLSAKRFYDDVIHANVVPMNDLNELESTLTHNLFYLAQAYGNAGDALKSSQYCLQVTEGILSKPYELLLYL